MASDPNTGFTYWLGTAAQRARKNNTTLSPEVLAPMIGVNNSTLRRFEDGKSLPRDLDRVLAAYAHFAGYDDYRDLIEWALKLWREEGRKPEKPIHLTKIAELLRLNTA